MKAALHIFGFYLRSITVNLNSFDLNSCLSFPGFLDLSCLVTGLTIAG